MQKELRNRDLGHTWVKSCFCNSWMTRQAASWSVPRLAEQHSINVSRFTSLQQEGLNILISILDTDPYLSTETGIHIVHLDHFPLPSFEIQFFSPTNKFAAGGAKLVEFIAQKDAFLRPFSPFLM